DDHHPGAGARARHGRQPHGGAHHQLPGHLDRPPAAGGCAPRMGDAGIDGVAMGRLVVVRGTAGRIRGVGMTSPGPEGGLNAIEVKGVSKRFKRRTIRSEYTSFKTELVQWLTGKRKANPQRWIEALREIDFVIPRGRTVGILGRNGSGKSTLLKLITGIYRPSTG